MGRVEGAGSSRNTGMLLFALPNATAFGFSSVSASSSRNTAIFDFPTAGVLDLEAVASGPVASSSRNTVIVLLGLCAAELAFGFVGGSGSSRNTAIELLDVVRAFELFAAAGFFSSAT